MMAVLTPMTRPCESTSGPPELPGFKAASVWMMSSMSRPERERSERPSALTTPVVTVVWKPSGLQIAGLDPNHREIGVGVVAHQIGAIALAVRVGDLDPPRSAHDVAVGEDQAVGGEDEPRPGSS